ncbi:hypothetical protein AAG594_10945 [Citromicrobium bathyomarinum]
MNDKPEKPKKPRKRRVDSAAGIAAAIVAGGKKITLPAGEKLSAIERKVFTEVCEEFSKSELTPHKIRLAIALSRNLAAMNGEQVALQREGMVLVNSHGNAYANPRVKIISGLHAAILSMRRSLGIHTRALEGGSNAKAALRRSHNKANEAILDDMDDDLIARPNVVPIRAQETEDDG